jgi:2-keto-4-pentenoate hydratase/2-oxohepta-3-ene-1,7-dioic acid hydratase in catechol pathway
MKFARFTAGGESYGGLIEDSLLKVVTGDIFGGYQITGKTFPLSEVQLLPPVLPSKIIGAGLNYKAVAKARGVEFPTVPILFLKPSSGIIGPDQGIVVPDAVRQPMFEVEIAVVIGKKGKNIPVDKAADYIFGFTLANDVTAKDHMIKGQPWTRGKAFDTFTPLGPWIVQGLDPDNIDLSLTINGEEKQKGNTSDMIFSIYELIADISSSMSLEPGDVILSGTPFGGSEFARGDTIELRSPQIGVMTNVVTGE